MTAGDVQRIVTEALDLYAVTQAPADPLQALLFEAPSAAPAAAAAKSALDLLDTKSLSGVASVSFTGFSAAYTDLILVVRGRSTVADVFDAVEITFNGDSGNNYDYIVIDSTGTFSFHNEAFMILGSLTGATGASADFGTTEAVIYAYNNTTDNKTSVATDGVRVGTASSADNHVQIRAGWWHNSSPAAITQIDVTLATGNGVANSTVSLYGRL